MRNTLDIEIFGPGCARCARVHKRVLNVLARLDIATDVAYMTNFESMVERGVFITPALFINGTLLSAGNVPQENKIEQWIRDRITPPLEKEQGGE